MVSGKQASAVVLDHIRSHTRQALAKFRCILPALSTVIDGIEHFIDAPFVATIVPARIRIAGGSFILAEGLSKKDECSRLASIGRN
jgi:hypothetical protein